MKWADLNLGAGAFLVSYHILFFLFLPLYLIYFSFSWGLAISALILFILCDLSITTGYHRYFAHKAYSTNRVVESILLFFGTLATQNSVIVWAHDHRIHHQYVDTEKDPYSVKHGFFHAHMGWMFRKAKNEFNPQLVKDLLDNPLVAFQHRYYLPLMIASNLLIVLATGWLFSSYMGAFTLVFLTRLLLVHHTTWSINSLAHSWGSKPYSKEQTSVNNWIVALITFGEGYHNYHHAFPNDYRNGVRWWQYDPTKAIIWMLSKFSLASSLKKVNEFIIKRKILFEDKRLMIANLKNRSIDTIEHLYTNLTNKITTLNTQIHEYKTIKQTGTKEKIRVTKVKIKALKKSIGRDWKEWTRISNGVIKKSTVTSS